MLDDFSAFVPWDTDMLLKGAVDIREKVGGAFNVAIWIFLVVSAVFIVITIFNKFAG